MSRSNSGWVVSCGSDVTAQQIIKYGFEIQDDRLYPDGDQVEKLLSEHFNVTDVTNPATTSLKATRVKVFCVRRKPKFPLSAPGGSIASLAKA